MAPCRRHSVASACLGCAGALASGFPSSRAQVCGACGGGDGSGVGRIVCDSIDCALYFRRQKRRDEAEAAAGQAAELGEALRW